MALADCSLLRIDTFFVLPSARGSVHVALVINDRNRRTFPHNGFVLRNVIKVNEVVTQLKKIYIFRSKMVDCSHTGLGCMHPFSCKVRDPTMGRCHTTRGSIEYLSSELILNRFSKPY